MHAFRASVVVCAAASLTLAACSPEAEQPPAPVEPSPQPTTPAAPAIGYACESGQTVEVQYPDTATAGLTYKGQSYVLRATPSPTGARYAGSGLEWVTASGDGQEGATLSRLGPNDDIGVAVLERCSRPTAGPNSGSNGPTGPAPAPGGAVVPAVAACRGPQLKLSNDGGDAGAGNRVAIVGVQNVGAQPCSLTGYPAVTLQDARGRTLTTVRSEQTGDNHFRSGNAVTPVVLASQAKAFFDIAWNVVPHEAQGETVCPSATRVRAVAPGDTSPASLSMTFTPCGSRIRVSPFRAVPEPPEPAAPATKL